jgi:hypothetical protein
MKTIFKFAAAVSMASALALAAATPGEARDGELAAGAVGFGAGTVVGAAAVNAGNNGYYANNGYYGDQGYGSAYAYEPTYPAPRYARYRNSNQGYTSCGGDLGYGRRDYTSC